MDRIRHQTRSLDFSSDAVEGFLNFAQAIDLVLETLTHEEPKNKTKTRYFSATPEIKLMSWEEWEHAGLPPNPPKRPHSAIDVLIDEYERRGGSNSSSYLPSSIHIDATASLPTRIRINSIWAQRILISILDVEDRWRYRVEPFVIVRPFKILAAQSVEIKAKFVEIEQNLAERRKKRETSEVAADEVPEPSNGTKGTLGHDGASCQEDHNTCPAIEEANEDHISDTESQSRMQARYHSVNLFTGTNWDEVELSAVEEAVNDFRCVVDFVNDTLQPVRSYLQNEPSSVNFNNIWHLFTTGSLVYVKARSTPQKIWKVIQATGGRRYLRDPDLNIKDWETKWSPFVIDCYHLDFDGTDFVRVFEQFTIEMFDGLMHLSGLQIMPLTVAERLLPGINRDEFRKRGEQFLTYLKPQFRYYHGTTLTQSPSGNMLYTQEDGEYDSHRLFTEQVESQVVVDFGRGIQANSDWAPPITEVNLWKGSSDEFEDIFDSKDIRTDSLWDSRASEEFLKKEEIKRQRWNKGEEMPEEDDLLLLPNRVIAYVLRSRSWGMYI
jgi:hypothetical protein